MAQKTILRTFSNGGVTYPYSEFLGVGLPSMDLGESGDVYVDITPGSLALYGRCLEEWKIWQGPQNRKPEDLVVHPSHPNRCLWCSDSSFGWFASKIVRGRLSGELQSSRIQHLYLPKLSSCDCIRRSFCCQRRADRKKGRKKKKVKREGRITRTNAHEEEIQCDKFSRVSVSYWFLLRMTLIL